MPELSGVPGFLNRLLLWLSCAVFVLAMAVAVVNVALRPFGFAVPGAYELMGFGSALLASLGLGYSQEHRSHISVDLLFGRFPAPVRRVLESAGLLACALFFGVTAWRISVLGIGMWRSGELSETLQIPYYPVVLGVSAGIWVFALTLASDGLNCLASRKVDS